MSLYTDHVAKWIDCEACELHERRGKVVIARGTVPCDVLFVGEAPGKSENVIGRPFVGPAGKLLDTIIDESFKRFDLTYALTNLVCCIPLDENGSKAKEPEKEYILACSDRLAEFVAIAKPKLVVTVGGLSTKWVPKVIDHDGQWAELVHPAAIIRMNIAQQGLAIQRSIVTLSTALEDLVESLASF